MLVDERVRVLAVVLLVAGCRHLPQTPAFVRTVELAQSPSEVRSTVAGRAHIAGMVDRGQDEDGVDRFVAAIETREVPRYVRDERDAVEPPVEKGQERYLVTAQTLPHRGGSVVEITGPSVASLDKLQVGGKTYEATDVNFTRAPVLYEVTTDLGFAQAPHSEADYRIDVTARFGYGLARGGDAPHVQARRRLLFFAGIGGGYDGAGYVRPEVGIAFDTQEVVTPLRQPIAVSLRKSISLSFAMPKGEGFTAYEGGISLAVPPYGGLFGRVGYELGDNRKGMTYFAGVQLGSNPTLGIAGAIALGWLVYYAVAHADINTCSEKNGPCE